MKYEPSIWSKVASRFSTDSKRKGAKNIMQNKSFDVPNVKIFWKKFQCFWLIYSFYWEWQTALCILCDFFGIRNLSGLNDLYSLISPKNLLTLMFPSALTLSIHFSSTLFIYFWHSFSWRLWRAGILLLTKFKGQRSNFHYSQFKKAWFKNKSRFKKDCCYNQFF